MTTGKHCILYETYEEYRNKIEQINCLTKREQLQTALSLALLQANYPQYVLDLLDIELKDITP